MDRLERFWACDSNLPFNPNVNEADVLDHILKITSLTQEDCHRIHQWIKFNKWCNINENAVFKEWTESIYAKIYAAIKSACSAQVSCDMPARTSAADRGLL